MLELSGSSNSYYRYYNIDKTSGKIVSLAELFNSEEGLKFLTEEIQRQMTEKMAADPEIVFWNNEEEFSDGFSALSSEHNYYRNENGDLVIPFDKYEIGPGSSGNPQFTIDKDLLNPFLKDEFKNS